MNPLPDSAEYAVGGTCPHLGGDLPGAVARAETAESDCRPNRAAKRRVLLVDDEENIIASLRRLLRREGYQIVTANRGPEAIRALEAEPVQLVVSDHRMPGMTGVELLREVRDRWPQTVRIILSGYSEVQTIIAAINEGEIYKFITKPWNDEEIKLHIRRAMEQQELEEENLRLAREIAKQNDGLRELNTLLEQRAADASTGLTSTQALLEAAGVGMITVDSVGLIVGANRHANEIISSEKSDLIGLPTQVALPEALYELVCTAATKPEGVASGRFELRCRELQCRVSPLKSEDVCWGSVVVLWEEVI